MQTAVSLLRVLAGRHRLWLTTDGLIIYYGRCRSSTSISLSLPAAPAIDNLVAVGAVTVTSSFIDVICRATQFYGLCSCCDVSSLCGRCCVGRQYSVCIDPDLMSVITRF